MSLWSRRLALAFVAALSLGLAACGKDESQGASGSAAPVADTAAFTILAGSELKDLEGPIVDAARAAGVDVKLSYAGTLDIVERINAGERFDAILPPNGAYPALALQTKPLARDKLFYSRIALGVKNAKAAQLGWNRKPPGWAEIAKAAGAGQLRYGMTNATSSNTGMSALFAVASALAGKTEDLSAQDVDEKTLKAFLAGQKLTAGSSGWLADAYVKDPSAIDAMVNYEAVILRANEKLPKADQLALFYPRDGMISADYPLMLLNAGKREAYTQLVATLKAAPFQRDALSAAFLRPANPEVPAVAALPTAAVAELGFPNRLDVIDAVLGTYQSQWRKPPPRSSCSTSAARCRASAWRRCARRSSCCRAPTRPAPPPPPPARATAPSRAASAWCSSPSPRRCRRRCGCASTPTRSTPRAPSCGAWPTA